MTIEYWILRDHKLREQARNTQRGGKQSCSYEQRRMERKILISRIDQHHGPGGSDIRISHNAAHIDARPLQSGSHEVAQPIRADLPEHGGLHAEL